MMKEPGIAFEIEILADQEIRVASRLGLDINNPDTWVAWYIGLLAFQVAASQKLPDQVPAFQAIGVDAMHVCAYLYVKSKEGALKET